MNKSTSILWLLSLIVLFSSCEGNTDRTIQIKNSTSGTINVIANTSNEANYTKLILVDQTIAIHVSSQLGGSDYVVTPSTEILSMIITNATGDTCIKDYIPQDNWDIKVEERSKIPSDWNHEYTFIIDNNDF